MRRIAVVIPVKGENPKGRLAALFDARQRKQLQLAMLEDLLQALQTAKKLQDVFIVSSDLEILKFAERFGVGSIVERGDQGVNHAVRRAISSLSRYDGWLVIPADVPLFSANDLRTVLELVRAGSSLVISPSEDYSGTNLLLMIKGSRIPLHYDDDSFYKHLREATTRKVGYAVYYSQNIAFDIDSAADVHRYFNLGRRNSTMTFLARKLRRPSAAIQSMKPRERDSSEMRD